MGRYFDIAPKTNRQTAVRKGDAPPVFGVRRISGRSSFRAIFRACSPDAFFAKFALSLKRTREKMKMWQYRLRVIWHQLSLRHEFLRHPASPFRVLKPSRLAILGAIVFGMAMTHTVERLINGSASADTSAQVAGAEDSRERTDMSAQRNFSSEELLALAGDDMEKPFEIEILSQFIEEGKQEKFEAEVKRMVAGYPIESMIPFILEKDRITATFLIGIAKKESNWGRRVPVLDGQDCFNYWGFRANRRLMGTGGHTCFNSKKDAVDSVSNRIENLIYEYERNTPEEMIVWKCGYSCAGHSPESVRKWIADVEGYYNALNDAEKE